MRKTTLPFLCAFTALLGCASPGKVKEQQAQIESLQAKAGELLGRITDKENRAAALESEKTELEGKLNDLTEKLKAAQARIDSLVQSNQELSQSLESNKGELARKVKELVAEKDELSRKLNETEKERIAANRARAIFLAKREKTLSELALLRQKYDDLAKEDEETAAKKAEDERRRSERLARVHEEMGTLADSVLKELQSEEAKITQSGETIELALLEPLLFEPRQAKITEAGGTLLDRVGQALRALPARRLRIEGHSDNTPIKWELFGRFTSHWDLSSARATAVARYLHEHAGLDPTRMTASGFGEFRPAKANDSEQGRAANRRVVLVIEPPAS